MTPRRSSALLAIALALTSTACAHWTPYYRSRELATAQPYAVASEVDHRLLLIGDAGDPNPDGEPALELLKNHIRAMPDRTTLVFLGDNVYERGVPEESSAAVDGAAQAANVLLPKIFDSRDEAERCLNAQIDTVRGTTARAIFIPGNHDWDPFGTGGWKRVLAQGQFLHQKSLENVDVEMSPQGGCPGPVSIPLGKQGMLIILDTQWWLEYDVSGKPEPDNNPTNCEFTTEKEVTTALVAELKKAAGQGRWTIVAAHHPLNTAGPHGGFVDPYTHLFPGRFMRHLLPFYLEWVPLPVLGTMAVLARRHFSPSPQDTSNASNEHLRRTLRAAMAEAEQDNAPVLAYAAGHDHSLQVFKAAFGPRYTLVSGLGSSSRSSEVGATNNTLFAHSNPLHPGFMQMDFLRNGHVRLAVLEADANRKGGGGEVFSMMLADAHTPRGARPAAEPGGVWGRFKQRATSTWQGWRVRKKAAPAP